MTTCRTCEHGYAMISEPGYIDCHAPIPEAIRITGAMGQPVHRNWRHNCPCYKRKAAGK